MPQTKAAKRKFRPARGRERNEITKKEASFLDLLFAS
jgi:hypothetical protein